MLTGSDVYEAGWLVPGFSLHHEFDKLARAGLSPLRVLQMATSDASDYLGKREEVGVGCQLAERPGRDSAPHCAAAPAYDRLDRARQPWVIAPVICTEAFRRR